MLKTSSVINTGNRIILIIFVLLLIIGAIYDETGLYFAAAFVTIIGLFQLVSAIIFNTIIDDKNIRNKVSIYLITVFTYILVGYLGGEFLIEDSGLRESELFFLAGSIPFILCVFFTYISEINVKNIKKDKQ